jgi:hypothetical protein
MSGELILLEASCPHASWAALMGGELILLNATRPPGEKEGLG